MRIFVINKIINKLFPVIIFLLINILTFNIDDCSAQWVQCDGINVGTVLSIATLEKNIFAGATLSGVYLSTNNGKNWTLTGCKGDCEPETDFLITTDLVSDTLTYDSIPIQQIRTSFNYEGVHSLSTLGNNIFAGAYGVYHTSDYGTSWIKTALNNETVYSLVSNGNNIFAGTGVPLSSIGAVYLSSDEGRSWTQTTLNNKTVYSLATHGNNIYAGTEWYGVIISTDNGTSWSQTALNNETVLSFAVLGNNIFAGTGDAFTGPGAIYLSTNNGMSWTQTALNNKYVYSLAANGNSIFAGTDSGVYFSSNNGMNWVQKNQGFKNIPAVYALLIVNDYIFAGNSDYPVWRRELTDILGY